VAGIKKVALARRREVFQGQFGHFTRDSTRLRQAALLAEHDVALISPTSKQARLIYLPSKPEPNISQGCSLLSGAGSETPTLNSGVFLIAISSRVSAMYSG